ncbi:unnamed protein product [Diabrotica balteata]|uniref:Single domain-containing protein n=1 Tax=Diabrotica balteata TaxID=107213 RepID=A0A9N9SWF2_DIABA|nr:unnamed protein product [Diabrotica balteata]
MNSYVVLVVMFLAVAFAAEEEAKADGPKTYRRLIPADVLRDFPGMCFASTKCATVEPGKSWDLTPFCGRSTCVVSEDKPPRLLELVEDCGPLPLANPKCKLDEEKTNKTAQFPYCCPQFSCEEGAKLEYPEIPTIAPVPEEPAATTTKA